MRHATAFSKYVLLGLIVLIVSYPAASQRGRNPVNQPPALDPNVTLPALNVIQNATLSPPYSCGNPGGYGTTALFLSGFNDPELLFNGACGSPDYFDVSLSGDTMSLIADLGANLPLDGVTTHAAFNLQNVAAFADYTRFSSVAQVVQGHTYAVLINQEYERGLFVFTVVKFVPDQEVDLQYEVKDYQVTVGQILRPPGFDWNK
ncbi:hypothetical protein SBA3_3040003 [Candidatus Sulfopaludibacter sp. SbA3]|nr:hypothetical protein SBA3_3040003 [Candidatus Sulfopaludibacter sp. SbA3]